MPADPKRVRDLFLAAAELPTGDRAAYLSANAGDDAELRAAVERLLVAHEQPATVLLRTAPGVPTAYFAPIAETVGTQIGPYKLMEQIGEGGFGLVFVAEQAEPLRRKVALKVIKPGMDSRQVIARFQAERQALALMDHPNIARVLDAGATGSGRPYFVMELVRGIPITAYCDQNHLPPRERLELFVSVCQAIQHAHQKGVIHRDIKPSNVLVTSHDGKPIAKVIDFGVAKTIHQPLTEQAIYTNFAQMIGTPLYMSPEQAEMSGLDIDTRSDIYSLGVLIYELLTGSTPLAKKRVSTAAYDEIRRLIREEEPPRPSTRLSSSDSLASIAAQRHTEPAKLSKLVRGDLDWITMKALEKDRTRRYETANGLARDIQRYLADEVVEARPPSTTYRLRKFARKYRAALTTAVALVLLLVAGITASTILAVRATRAEAAARDAQQAEAERAAGERRANAGLAAKNAELAAEQAKVEARNRELAAEQAKAKAQQLRAEGNAYAARAQLIQTTWHDAQAGRGLKLLEDQRPAGGEPDLRNFEWRLLSRWWHSELLALAVGDSSPNWLSGVAFSRDGRRLAAGSGKAVKVWDVLSGEPKQTIRGHFEEISGIAFSPDGTRLAVLCRGKTQPVNPVQFKGAGATVTVWDWAGAEQLLRFDCRDFWSYDLAYSPDGRLLAAASMGAVELHDAETGKEHLVLKCPARGSPAGAAFSPSGERIAASIEHGSVKVWEIKTGRQIHSFKGPVTPCRSVAYSPDGDLVAGNFGSQIVVWDAADGRVLATINHQGTSYGFTGIAFSPDSSQLAAASERMVQLWDAYTGKEIRTYKGNDAQLSALAFSPEGTRLAGVSIDGTVKVWDAVLAQDSFCLSRKGRPAAVVVFNADGRLISANDDFHVHFWDAGSGKETFSFRGPGVLKSLAPSPDGRRIVTGAEVWDDKKGYYGHFDVCVWDSTTGQNLMTYRGHADWINGVAFSPDGTQVASCSRDGTVRVLDAETGRHVRILHGHDGWVNKVAFNPAGRQLASTGNDGFVKVWNLITGQEASPLQDPKHGGTCVAYSSDGTRLAASAWDGTATIWDAETGKHLLTLKGPHDRVAALDFSPDGHRLATSARDGKVRLWDTSSGQEVFSLQPDTGGFGNFDIYAAFSPDGKRLATGRNTVMLWETMPPSAEDLRRRQATGLVEALFRGLVVKARVRSYLQQHPALDDAFRKEALAVADFYPQNARELNDASWQAVRSAMEPKGVYARALLQAEEASRLDPNNSAFRNSLGVACYRMGRYKDAQKHLEQADTLYVDRSKTSQPIDLAFLAMAHHQLGQTEPSKALLAKLRAALKDDQQGKYDDAQRFLDEAEELIEGSQPAHGIQGATRASESGPQKK